MQDQIRDLISRFQYSAELKKTAVFRILFGGEDVNRVMADLAIHNSYTLRNWVSLYQQKIQMGLIPLPAMKKAQKRDNMALNQTEQSLKRHWKPKVYKQSKPVREQGQFS